MNQVTLTGNVCRDFELRQTANGTSVASNTIAVKRDRKEADGSYATDFFDVICFGPQADFAVKYIRKGDRVGVAGNIQIRDYTARNGAKGRAVEVIVNSIESLMPKEDAEDTPKAEEPKAKATTAPKNAPAQDSVGDPTDVNTDGLDLPDDDLPF